jgi:acyl-CoA dehydrogenase
MDLSIPVELESLQQTVREFVRRELLPLEAQIEIDDYIDPQVMRKLQKRSVEVGLYGFNLPTDVGGGGVGPLGQVLVGEAMGQTTMALGEALGRLPQALRLASPQQLDWFLKPALLADITVCNALTEPDAGSDLAGLSTRAEACSDGWRLNGAKQFISNAEVSDYMLVLAVNDPGAPLRQRFTTFIVDRTNPGVQMMPRYRKMGWRGYPISAFAMTDCVVDSGRVLGEVGRGFEVMMESVNMTRLYLASKCVGTAREALRLSREYANLRKTFGRRLGEHQAIQFRLADMDVDIEAARMLVLAAAFDGEAGRPSFRIAASRAKLFATEMLGRVADSAVVVFGAAGYMSDLPIERIYRDARAFRIGEGTSEMQRIQIGRHVLLRR